MYINYYTIVKLMARLMIISDYVYYYELGMLLKVENVEIFLQY